MTPELTLRDTVLERLRATPAVSAVVDAAPLAASAPSSISPPKTLPTFNAFVTATGAHITEGSTRACYVPATDTIHLPTRAAFHTPTRPHAHTLRGHVRPRTHSLDRRPHRLARDLTARFGARAYAAEELTAELGAAFVLADLGLARTPHPDHAAYCASWAPLLRADPRALSHAATQASRAADYLAALQPVIRGSPRRDPAGLCLHPATGLRPPRRCRGPGRRRRVGPTGGCGRPATAWNRSPARPGGETVGPAFETYGAVASPDRVVTQLPQRSSGDAAGRSGPLTIRQSLTPRFSRGNASWRTP